MTGYWMKPKFNLVPKSEGGGGELLLGPLQFNWYNKGFRVYLTWPGRTRGLHFG